MCIRDSCSPRVTPGPYSNIEVSKPLLIRRLACKRLTRPIDPSKATVWKVSKAYSPGSALTSGNTFSS